MAIIPLARPLPAGSSDLPGGRSRFQIGALKFEILDSYAFENLQTRLLRAGRPLYASLFGLAPRGVCLAAHVTTRAGALLH